METENTTVWTLFHGDQLRKQECLMDVAGDVDLSNLKIPESGICYTPSLTAEIPSIMARYNHLLLFDGLIPVGGASDRVRSCRLSGAKDDMYGSGVIITLVAPVDSAKDGTWWDIGLDTGSLFTLQRGTKYASQKSLRQMIAIPKKENRSLILTFKDRSLAPWWRVIKSSAKELVVETANSY